MTQIWRRRQRQQCSRKFSPNVISIAVLRNVIWLVWQQDLAATGMVPFASSFAMFAAGRAFEQIRNSVGYPKLNVKIGATHAGISVGEDGATHQCNEDIALMRTIPGMVVD